MFALKGKETSKMRRIEASAFGRINMYDSFNDSFADTLVAVPVLVQSPAA